MLIIGDVHGCYSTLMELLTKAKWDGTEQLYFVGDLIDRGPRVKEVVDFVMNGGHSCVKGNHEDMCVGAYHGLTTPFGITYRKAWIGNGYKPTQESFGSLAAMHDGGYIDWMDNLPAKIVVDGVSINGAPICVSHSFVFSYPEDDEVQIMWNRWFYINEEIYPDKVPWYNVFGHTPTPDGPILQDNYALIDTGCVYQYTNVNKATQYCLTALRVRDGMHVPDIEVIKQECIDGIP